MVCRGSFYRPVADTAEGVARAVADSENLKREGGAEDNVSAPSSYIANAHNELICLKYGKRRLIEKNMDQ